MLWESPLEDCVPLFRVKLVSGLLLAYSQVREARTLYVRCLDGSFDVAKSVKLAQASLPRLGEINRGSPIGVSPKRDPAGATAPCFEPSPRRMGARLSETLQPERDAGRDSAMVALQWSGRNSMAPVSGCPWWCPILHNSVGSLGENSRVALQGSGRNAMAPVSGCPWWCPVCITRDGFKLGDEQLRFEQRYPPQVQASAESD
ncbi:hypothetical protein DEO72_LG6g1209 [Vigna unguiculata]|uniref:Uncharacterized protein n=1 Tax=Vigna unguiculata TaxID=3917 RepID=A0A4D6M5M1_VIGUN|nr:hypothetical protein DEO72_LG6g1209 [Vigna unguiculata]